MIPPAAFGLTTTSGFDRLSRIPTASSSISSRARCCVCLVASSIMIIWVRRKRKGGSRPRSARCTLWAQETEARESEREREEGKGSKRGGTHQIRRLGNRNDLPSPSSSLTSPLDDTRQIQQLDPSALVLDHTGDGGQGRKLVRGRFRGRLCDEREEGRLSDRGETLVPTRRAKSEISDQPSEVSFLRSLLLSILNLRARSRDRFDGGRRVRETRTIKATRASPDFMTSNPSPPLPPFFSGSSSIARYLASLALSVPRWYSISRARGRGYPGREVTEAAERRRSGTESARKSEKRGDEGCLGGRSGVCRPK